MTNEQEVITPENIDTLVDASGIRMWQPKTWRDWAGANKKLVVYLSILLIIALGTFITSITLVQANAKLEKDNTALETKNRQLKTDLDNKQVELNKANSHIQDCQAAVETAWKAWNRRNDLVVSVLSNIFTSNTVDIESDNTLAAAEFLTAYDCNPNMLSSSIFTQ